jgi:hypothetical protein
MVRGHESVPHFVNRFVIPAKAGIHCRSFAAPKIKMGTGLRRNDGRLESRENDMRLSI